MPFYPIRLAVALVSLVCAGVLLVGGCASPSGITPAPKAASNAVATTAKAAPEKSGHPKKLAIVFVTSTGIAAANFPIATLGPWLNTALSDCEEVLATEINPPRLLVQITLRKNGDPIYELSGQPKLSKSLDSALHKALAPLPTINPPFCDVVVRLQDVDENNGNPLEQASHFQPQLDTPEKIAADQFAKASIADEFFQLKTWAREIALPILSAEACGADPKFVGVVNMGKLTMHTDFNKSLDVEALTFHNPDYWRGVMEMAPGNAGVTAMPILLFAANGEFTKANKLLQMVRPFSASEPLGSNLLDALASRLSILDKKVTNEITRGISLHDAGKFDDAVKAYKQLLAIYPCSAWARYELFFSELHKHGPKAMITEGQDSWRKAAPEIFAQDPLFDTQFLGERGKDKGDLLDRLWLRILKEGKINDQGELVGRTAELAVRLECYGYAAHIYWLSLHSKLSLKESGLPEKKELTSLKTEDVICRYLYCLEKLGCPEWKKEFKGNFSTQFAKFDEELEKHRRQ